MKSIFFVKFMVLALFAAASYAAASELIQGEASGPIKEKVFCERSVEGGTRSWTLEFNLVTLSPFDSYIEQVKVLEGSELVAEFNFSWESETGTLFGRREYSFGLTRFGYLDLSRKCTKVAKKQFECEPNFGGEFYLSGNPFKNALAISCSSKVL